MSEYKHDQPRIKNWEVVSAGAWTVFCLLKSDITMYKLFIWPIYNNVSKDQLGIILEQKYIYEY